MRKKLILLLLAFSATMTAQNVSTEVTKRNVLMEDFTGIKCGNCPDGHKYVNKLLLGHPDRIFPIAVHAGYYATPSAVDQPDFITDEGTEIHDYFRVDTYGYPCGMTNRKDMGMAGRLQSRSYWIASCRSLTREDAEVNVWVASKYNKDTHVITTDVELYYTSDVENNSSALCVSLLQSHMLGPQAGANMGDEYIHNHVLRDMFTPTWGDTIHTSTAGTLVQQHYEYTLPEVIGNMDTDPQHLDIVAYVIDADREVMNVSGCPVECPDMVLPLAATLDPYKILPVRNNAFPYLECYLVNEGTEPITSADFLLTLDEEDEYTCTWTASEGDGYEPVHAQTRGYLKVPVEWPASVIKYGCDYSMRLIGLNGQSYKAGTIKGTFAPMLTVKSDLVAKIKTDKFADDNTFRLFDANGNQIAEYGPYEEGKSSEYEETIHFPESGIYCFEVADEWGNGMLNPRGSIKWYDSDEKLVAQNTEIEDWGYRIFFSYEEADGIEETTSDLSSLNSHLYNLQGQRVSNPQKGDIYIQNGKKIIK